MVLYVVADFLRRRKPRRPDDDIPAGPLLLMLVFWVLFGLGALAGGLAIVAGLTGAWIICIASAIVSAGALFGSVVSWMSLNRLD